MKLENGYKFIYGVKLEELYATKVLPGVEGKQLVFKNAEDQAIELKQFKLLYSDGENLYGSLLSYPEGPEKDIKIIVEDEEGNLVAGVKEAAEEQQPAEEEAKEPVEENNPGEEVTK